MKSFALALAALAACGSSPPSAADATPAVVPDAPPVATVVYLSFEGETVSPGPEAPWDDESPLVKAKSTVAPLYANDPDRQAKIATIVADVTTALQPYDIDLTTTRPATGPYTMIVFGGNSSDLGLGPDQGWMSDATCGSIQYHLDFVFDGWDTPHDVAAAAIAALGSDRGVSFTTDPADCMCMLFADSQQYCNALSRATACTIGGANTPVNPQHACNGFTTIDERAEFARAFGTR